MPIFQWSFHFNCSGNDCRNFSSCCRQDPDQQDKSVGSSNGRVIRKVGEYRPRGNSIFAGTLAQRLKEDSETREYYKKDLLNFVTSHHLLETAIPASLKLSDDSPVTSVDILIRDAWMKGVAVSQKPAETSQADTGEVPNTKIRRASIQPFEELFSDRGSKKVKKMRVVWNPKKGTLEQRKTSIFDVFSSTVEKSNKEARRMMSEFMEEFAKKNGLGRESFCHLLPENKTHKPLKTKELGSLCLFINGVETGRKVSSERQNSSSNDEEQAAPAEMSSSTDDAVASPSGDGSSSGNEPRVSRTFSSIYGSSSKPGLPLKTAPDSE
jgi:hypothetical protein